METFNSELSSRLNDLREQGLYRELRRVDSPQRSTIQIGGKAFLNFSSNDYLGLANHPSLIDAASLAVNRFGVGAGASRLICGSMAPFHELEETLAAFKSTEAALTFSTGYATALGTITALLDKDDVVIIDKLVHASIVDGAKLSGAKLRVFAHNDLNDLEEKLKWARTRSTGDSKAHTLIVTESIFSMDGDAAPLKEIVELKNKYGAWLMVDEAHATGILGKSGRGLAEELGVSNQIEIQMGTLGKALGASGGYICGSRALIEYLVNSARSFIFSTAPIPASAAAARAAIQLIQSREGDTRRNFLSNRIAEFKKQASQFKVKSQSTILPLIIGDEVKATNTATALRDRGIYVPAIRYPTVARGKARLRITLTASHSSTDVTTLLRTLDEIVNLS
jgi:8-amino-7-oxononanoate synthase